MSVTMPWTASDDTPVNGVANKIDDVRNALSKEAEHLAEIAAKYGREAGAHASDIAEDAAKQAGKLADAAAKQASKLGKDTGSKAQPVAADQAKQAGGWLDGLLKAIAALGTAFALSGRKTADDLNTNAKSAADDLRKLRLTTEPEETGPDFTPGITLLAGFGAGIALMYFLDPEKGRERRSMIRDRLMSLTKSRSANNDWASEETQTWQPDGYSRSDDVLETNDYSSATGFGATEPSTTDTWGTAPRPAGSTEIAIS